MATLRLIDIEKGLKRGLYRLLNQANGSALVWDSEKRQYVGHVEMPQLEKEAEKKGIDIHQWVGYGDGNRWGSNGW